MCTRLSSESVWFIFKCVDNKAIANVFYETADLMEINGDDSFRIRSYRRAAEALEGLPQQVSQLID